MSDLNKKKREEESGEEKGTRKHGCLQLSRAFFGTKWYFHMRLSQTKGQL